MPSIPWSCAVLAGATAFPQEKGDPILDVAPVVVTPTRGPEPLLEVPQAISVVDERKLRRLMPQNTPDALREEPGLAIQSSNQGGGSPILRGRSGKDVLIAIDGQRFSNSTFRRNHQYLNTIDLFAIGSIEVARGPASVLYGSDAMGGAINLLARRREIEGHWDAGGRLRFQYDSANEGVVAHADAEVEADGWGVFSGLTARDLGDLEAGSVGDPIGAVDTGGRQVPTAYREQAANVSVVRRLGEHDTLDFVTLYSRQWSVPASERVIPNEKNPSPTDLEREFDPQRLRWMTLRWRHRHPGATVEAVQAVASLNAPVEGRERVRAATPTVRTFERDELTAPGFSLQTALAWAPRHRLTVGGEGYFETVDSSAYDFDYATGVRTDRPTGRYPDGAEYDTLGLFVQDEWKLGGGFEWVNGVRWSRIRADLDFEGLTVGSAGPFGAFDETWNDVTFATGLSRQLDESRSVYGSVSRGFRAPNLDDLAAVGDFAAGNRVPSFDVDPEKVWNLEIGANHRDAATRAGGAVAVAFYRDLLVNEYAFTLAGEDYFVVDNSDHAVIWSFEAWVEQQVIAADARGWSHWLLFQGFANFGRNTSADEPVSKVPPPEAMVGWRVEGEGGGRRLPWRFETFARGALEQDRLAAVDELDPRIPEDGTPAWWTLNFRGGVRAARGLWLTAGLENVFNYRYRIHGSGIDAPGRSLVAAVEWIF